MMLFTTSTMESVKVLLLLNTLVNCNMELREMDVVAG
jgi:hypothetical protein